MAAGTRIVTAALLLLLAVAGRSIGQTSSIGRRFAAQAKPARKPDANPRSPEVRKGNPTIERNSLIAVRVKPPKKFVRHDLITIIIREQVKFEADGELETKKKFDVKSTLSAFFKPVNGGLGAALFSRGVPNVDYKYNNRLKNETDKDREDRLTLRVTSEVIDVKPNGNLVLQARAAVVFDNEVRTVALTGVVRSVDVTPDNTVLSTQLADKHIAIRNTGAVRDGSRRGWMARLLDLAGPF